MALAALAGPAAAAGPGVICVEAITGADYALPTTRYPHGALGDDEEWGALVVGVALKMPCRAGASNYQATLPEELVFEDVSPRLWDMTGDGKPEVVVVESHADKGARLAVWGIGETGLERLAATEFIGTRNRWLAPVGAADLDGDGAVELAFVDRPHLARVLRVFRWVDGQLVEIASLSGVTNHRFGASVIEGGLRDCDGGPELVVADADWRRLVGVRLVEGVLDTRDLGGIAGPESFEAARACR
ncbi:FG-GAP repeat domain-containing protein [Vannielia litorea]|uniref:FG-GAP repeat domain-containing protein n=1 Tax=Vannielia litorea TaxID=1217970 RepID=UPI00094154C1|nr:VCBS repeat-containing protein [Vannielia litorea]